MNPVFASSTRGSQCLSICPVTVVHCAKFESAICLPCPYSTKYHDPNTITHPQPLSTDQQFVPMHSLVNTFVLYRCFNHPGIRIFCLNVLTVLPLYLGYRTKRSPNSLSKEVILKKTSQQNILPLGGGWRAEALYKIKNFGSRLGF